ncbi:MAG TPA: nuclear transport factor 2 family protein, partial [Gemmatimonadales bacterium]|nr:nuclear transport factor 2 family protein [Gemmatimonadales bacterium]
MSRSERAARRGPVPGRIVLALAALLAAGAAGCRGPQHVVHSSRRSAHRASLAAAPALPDSLTGDTNRGAPDDSGARGDAAGARRAILGTLREYVRASNAGDVPALVRLYTDDALVLPPSHPPIEGRRAIAAFWRQGIDSGFALTPLRVDVHGDVAWVVGRYTLPATAQDPADTGKSVFCLHRQ